MKKFLTLITLIAVLGTAKAQDNVAPSVKPPTSVDPANAPMFVILGWDDNSYADAFTWFLDFIKDKKNKNGIAARTTFFNTSERASTLVVAEDNQTGADVLNAWKRAYNEGHEIANHTVNHGHGKAYDAATWTQQIGGCNTFLKNNVGVGEVYGFRTPFLEFGAGTFDALRGAGMLYDCSVEYGYGAGSTQMIPGGSEWGDWVSTGNEKGRKYGLYWPFTLNNGAPQGAYTNGANLTVPGFWEFMVNTYLKPASVGTGEITGFDYNVFWSGAGNFSAEQVFEIWKYNFDLQRAGWKAPLMLNIHTDYYSDWNTDAKVNFTKSTVATRRKAIEDFINYVLQFDDVRVVPAIDVIKWMRNPLPYQSDNAGPFTLDISKTNGTVNASPSKTLYTKGDVVSLTAIPNTDYIFTGWSGGASGTSNPISVTINSNTNVTANFKFQPASCNAYMDMMTVGEFAGFNDAIGSTNTMTATTSKVTSTWSQPKRTGTDWPWLNVDASLPSGTLKGACSIKITYKSDQNLTLALPQPSLAATGESFMIKLPAAATATTITEDITNFAKPSWATATNPLALDSVTVLSIAPDVDTELASISGSFEITELKIYGLGSTTSMITNLSNDAFMINSLHSESLNLSSINAGEYAIAIYSVDGKELYNKTNNLSKGQNTIAMNQSLAEGVYFVKVLGNNTAVSEKVFLTK